MVSSYEFSIHLVYCTLFGINVVRDLEVRIWNGLKRNILISCAMKIGSLVHNFIKEWIQTVKMLPWTKSPILLPIYNVRGATIMSSLCVEMTNSTSYVLVIQMLTFNALRDRLSFSGSRPSLHVRKTYWGSWSITPFIHNLGSWLLSGQFHEPAALLPLEKKTWPAKPGVGKRGGSNSLDVRERPPQKKRSGVERSGKCRLLFYCLEQVQSEDKGWSCSKRQ